VAGYKSPERLRHEVQEWRAESVGAEDGPGFAPAQPGG